MKNKKIKNTDKTKLNNENMSIFGSYARREQKKKSDLDVLVKFYKKATLFEFVGPAFFLEEKLGIKKVDVVSYETVREELKEYIFKETIYIPRT
jgi:uncharacterized protein